MSNDKCDTCSRELLENELPENRTDVITPHLPRSHKQECFICYCERADLDGPHNNSFPNHEKDEQSYYDTLKELKSLRDN